MDSRDVLICQDGLVLRMTDSAAMEYMRGKPRSRAVILDFVSEEVLHESNLDRLDLFAESIGEFAERDQVVTIPLLSFNDNGREYVGVLILTSRGRTLTIRVQRIGLLTEAADSFIGQTSYEAVASVAERGLRHLSASGDWVNYCERVSSEVTSLNSLLVSQVIDEVTSISRRVFNETLGSTHYRKRAFERILDSRVRLHEMSSHLQARDLGTLPTAQELRNAIVTCDAITASLAGMASVILQEQVNIQVMEERASRRYEETVQAEHVRRETKRDQAVARFAAVLLVPGLWFAFLGANVLPERVAGLNVQSTSAMLLSLGIGSLLALGGWFLLPSLIPMPKTELNNDE